MPQALIRVSGTSPTTDATIKIELPRYKGIAEDYHNIRFRTMTGRVIPHWVEDTSKGIIWVKLPKIGEAGAIFYVEWGNWNVGKGDIEGIAYKGIGDDFEGTSLDTSKWNQGTGSAGGTISVEDGVLKLAPNKPSSGSNSCCIWTNTTITNGFVIRERRKFTNEYYADLGLPVEEPSSFNTFHASGVCSQIYGFNQQTPISGSNAKCVYLIYKYSDGYSYLDYIQGSNLTSLNAFHINEYYYTHDGLLRWIHTPSTGEPGWDLSATHTAYLDDQKYILLFQGKYYKGNGGTSYIDWVFVRKYLDPEPEVLDIRLIPSIEEILPYIVTTTAGTPFVISFGSAIKVGSDTSKNLSSQEKVGASKEHTVVFQESVAQPSQRVVTSENAVGEAIEKEYATQEKIGQETYPIHTATQETIAHFQKLLSATITAVARLKEVALTFQSRVGKTVDKNIETESVVASETVYQKLGVENRIATLRTLQTQLQEAVSELAERSIASRVKVGESVEYNISVITSLAESFESVLASVEKVYRALETHAGMESAVSEFSEKALAVVESVAESSEIILSADISVKELILRILRTLVEVADKLRTLVEVVERFSTTVE